ncbi:DUF1479-domain-containing protein [Astrocystis sublimbata]|nr:DUF1479-domain-containing protein [Astrocystis sublimbata]
MATTRTHTAMPTLTTSEPIPLTPRFAKLKRNMIACREKAVADSFYRLLRALRREADEIASQGPAVVPTIDYFDIHDGAKASAFRKALRRRGVAVIRRVVPPAVAQAWREETDDYVGDNNPRARGGAPSELFDLYWSPSQVRARVDSRLLDAQRFAMGAWRASDEQALVSGRHPVVYADRLRTAPMPEATRRTTPTPIPSATAHVDNGSVERWEPDGYGASGTYRAVFSGDWEDFNPWDSSPRLQVTTDLYNRSGSCSMFRMFQGFLSLSSVSADSGSGGDALAVCPMLQLSTAYLLLRPFFTPRHKSPMENDDDIGMGMSRAAAKRAEADFLHPNNWNLNVSQTSILHGAVPGYEHELNTALHPHLQLHRTMVSVPDLEPGDYVIWHPDAIHAVDGAYFPRTTTSSKSTSAHYHPDHEFNNTDFRNHHNKPYSPTTFSLSSIPSTSNYSPNYNPFISNPTSPTTSTPHSSSSSRSGSLSSFASLSSRSSSRFPSSVSSPSHTRTHSHSHNIITNLIPYPPHPYYPPHPPNPNTLYPPKSPTTNPPTLLYIPACPLTQTNALYLASQRRSFLLGLPAPDFSSFSSSSSSPRECGHANVQDVADAGGEDGLRAMGLAPFEDAEEEAEGEVWNRSRRRSHHHHHHSSSSDSNVSNRHERERVKEVRLLRLANEILFPDRFDSVRKRGGGRR